MQRRSRKITVREFLVLFLIISLMTFIGLTSISADENETENNHDIVENGENETDDMEASFQNSAQAQHANNVASRAALNNETVAALIAKAEETGEESDITAAEEALATEIGVLTDEIAAMRGDDMGWGHRTPL